MERLAKRDAWRDPGVAARYEERRFSGPLGRAKHGRDVRLVLRLLAAAGAPRRVLDLPCGTGRLLPALEAAGHRVVGADVSREMLGVARGRGPGRVVQADGLRLPFGDGAFDAAVSLRFLFHLDGPRERVALLRELARVAGGTVVGQVRYRGTLKHLGRFVRSRVGLSARWRPAPGRAEIAAELGEAGLRLVMVAPVSRLFSDKVLFVARR